MGKRLTASERRAKAEKPGLELSIRTFKLVRDEDESGVSGTGIVAEGVKWSDGECAVKWLTFCSSTGIYKNVESVQKVHGHQGKTRVVFDDGEPA